MNEHLGWGGRIARVVVPTLTQGVVCVLLAAAVTIGLNLTVLGSRFIPVTAGVAESARNIAHANVASWLHTNIAEQAGLIVFWSLVGLAIYVICWSAYNVMVEARNEVELATDYSNQGKSRPHPARIVIIRLAALVGLGVVAKVLPLTLTWSIASVGDSISAATLPGIINGLVSILILAINLYALIPGLQFVLTRWYEL